MATVSSEIFAKFDNADGKGKTWLQEASYIEHLLHVRKGSVIGFESIWISSERTKVVVKFERDRQEVKDGDILANVYKNPKFDNLEVYVLNT